MMMTMIITMDMMMTTLTEHNIEHEMPPHDGELENEGELNEDEMPPHDDEVENEDEMNENIEQDANVLPMNQQPAEVAEENNLEEQMDANYGVRSGRYDLRPRRKRDFSHMFTNVENKQTLSTP